MNTYTKRLIALALVSSASLMAQTAPTAPVVVPDEKPIVLDTFTVNTETDKGYTAVDALAGGRSNLPLRLTPAPISSLTRAFIDDVQITNVKDALRWTAGAVPQNWRGGKASNGNEFNSWAFTLRGSGNVDQGGNPPSRNYFPNYVNQDLYNVDRVEAARGPNSILFGVGDLGGSITTYTKIPRQDRDITDVTISATSYGGVRFSADVNRVLGKHLAVRVNLLEDHDKGWRDGDESTARAADINTLFKLNEKTKFRLEVEGYEKKQSIYAPSLHDHFSLWNGTSASETWGAAPAGFGVGDANPLVNPSAPGVNTASGWGPNNWKVIIPGLGLMDWKGSYKSIGLNDVSVPASDAWRGPILRPDSFDYAGTGRIVPALPSREFTISPGDGHNRSKYYAVTASWEQTFNEHAELQVTAYTYSDTQKSKNANNDGNLFVDINKQLPNGQPNPNFGKKYADTFILAQNQPHSADELRAQFNYHFDATVFGKQLKQWFGVSGGIRETHADPRTYLGLDTNVGINPNNWTDHLIWWRLYIDNPRASIPLDNVVFTPTPSAPGWFDFNSQEKIKYAGIVSQTRMFDDRLTVTVGARQDKYDSFKQWVRPTPSANAPTIVHDKGTTYSAGVVGYVTKWLALTYNYAENFAPLAGSSSIGLFGDPPGAARGTGQTVGIRLSTEDGKYSGSINYYKDKSTGRVAGSGVSFQNLWNLYIKSGGAARDIGPAGQISGTGTTANAGMQYADHVDLELKGWEFDFTANPTENLRLQANFALPKAIQSNALADSRRYLAAHLADWTAITTQTGGTVDEQLNRQSLKDQLAGAQSSLTAQAVPVIQDHLIKSTASFFATWTFTNDALKGWSVGAGGSTYGRQYTEADAKVNDERVTSPGYTLLNMLVAYKTDFNTFGHKVKAKFQLNVDNLLDSDKLLFRQYSGYGPNNATLFGQDFDFIDPRKFTLTATFSF